MNSRELITPIGKTSAISRKGQRRVHTIVRAATEVLTEEGIEHFSVNKVAAKVGISLGNLQYYFPKRSDLVKSMLEKLMARGLKDIVSHVPTDASPIQQAELLVDMILQANKDIAIVKLMVSIWAMSLYNDDIDQIHKDWYVQFRKLFKDVVSRINPDLDELEKMHIATMALTIVEGSALFIGAGCEDHQEDIQGFEARVKQTVLDIMANAIKLPVGGESTHRV